MRRVIPLMTAAGDPRLLAATLTLRPRQRDLLASLDGPERMHVWSIGRQSGKTTVAAMFAVHNAALRPDLDEILPKGRTRYVIVACPAEAQAKEFIRNCESLVTASPLLSPLATVQTDRIDFDLPDGARSAIRALPANSRTVRGLTASAVICDEFAHFTDTAGPGSDEQMLTALEPSTRVFGDAARVLLVSTPFGESGRFYELFTAAEGGVLPSARAVHAPVWEFDPSLDEAWREAKSVEVGEDVYRQEFGAEWVSGGGAFFDLRGVELGDGPVAPEDGRRWVAGLDPAFHGDRFGVALVGESVAERGVLVVGRVDGIEPGRGAKSFARRRAREDSTLAKVWEIIEPYAPRIVSDQHQAEAIRSYFGRLGRPVSIVNLTAPRQTTAFTSTRTRLIDGSLQLWRHPLLIEELKRVKARDTEAILLPRFGGGHCDIASALALAVSALNDVTDAPPGTPRSGIGKGLNVAPRSSEREVGWSGREDFRGVKF